MPAQPLSFEEHTLDTGSVRLHYVSGQRNGIPLVFLHGGSARWQAVLPLMTVFAERYFVIAPDLRGHGQSEHTPNRYRMQDFAADLCALLATLPEAAVVFGHSLGGQAALMAAAQCPERFRALIVGDSPLSLVTLRSLFKEDAPALRIWIDLSGKPEADIRVALKEYPVIWGDVPTPRPAREAFGEDSPWFASMAASLASQDPTVLTTRLEDFEATHEGFEMSLLLPHIGCPTLLIQADPARGGLLTDAELISVLQLVPDAQHIQLPGIGHGLFTEQLEPVAAAISAFLIRHGL